MTGKFEGKTAIFTGAARGIGRGFAAIKVRPSFVFLDNPERQPLRRMVMPSFLLKRAGQMPARASTPAMVGA